MRRNLDSLAAFAVVAKERSFTRSAAGMGVSKSALSQTIRKLEEELGVRLLTRTTRGVGLTEAGRNLLQTVAPCLEEIETKVTTIMELREKPAGTLRLSAGEPAVHSIVYPVLRKLLPQYPDIRIEITTDYGLNDIVTGGYDGGIRLGKLISRDMIAVPIGPDIRMAVVGSPDYFGRHPIPETPQDLTLHNCIQLRYPSPTGMFIWAFGRGTERMELRVEGQIVVNSTALRMAAAIDGLGVAYMPEDQAIPEIAAGRLVRVLEDWCPLGAGWHLYYPSRRNPSAAFGLFVNALRYRGGQQGGPA